MGHKPPKGSWVHPGQFPWVHLCAGTGQTATKAWGTRAWGWDSVKHQKSRCLPSSAQQWGWIWAKTPEQKPKNIRLKLDTGPCRCFGRSAGRLRGQQDDEAMKQRKGSFARHSWNLHKYLYITEKYRKVINCDKVPNSGCYQQVLTLILDDVEGTIVLGRNLIIKGVGFCQVLLNSSCFTFIGHNVLLTYLIPVLHRSVRILQWMNRKYIYSENYF